MPPDEMATVDDAAPRAKLARPSTRGPLEAANHTRPWPRKVAGAVPRPSAVNDPERTPKDGGSPATKSAGMPAASTRARQVFDPRSSEAFASKRLAWRATTAVRFQRFRLPSKSAATL